MFALTNTLNREQSKTKMMPLVLHAEGEGGKKQFDCFDFCRWSLGAKYSFDDYIVPEDTVGMTYFDELNEYEDQ